MRDTRCPDCGGSGIGKIYDVSYPDYDMDPWTGKIIDVEQVRQEMEPCNTCEGTGELRGDSDA